MGRIVNRNELLEVIKEARASGKKIVMANGAFDLFHVGHLRYLRGAKELADILIVAMNDDKSVRKLKGKNRPVVPLEDRMAIVAAMEPVDFVVPFSELTVENMLRMIKPDIHAKGTDYTEETVPEKEVVASYGGKVAIVGDPKDHSSTEFIDKILKS